MRAALLCYLSVCFNMEPPEALPDAVTRIQLASASRLMQIWPNGVQQKLGFTSQIFVSDNIRLTNLCAYAPESALARRRAGLRGTKAQVFRLDWHRFELNVGERYPSPNPGRHKPSVRCNLPHVDLPQRNVRHWPWRQHLNDWVAATHEPVVQTHELRPDPKPNFLKLRKRRLLNFVRGARNSEQARARVA